MGVAAALGDRRRSRAAPLTRTVRCLITHHGVPVGAVDLDGAEPRLDLPVRPLDGYASIQPVVRAGSVALANFALHGGDAPADGAALRRGTELGRELELRDEGGALVPTDFIVLTEWPGGNPEVAATLRLRDAHAVVPAVVRTPPARDGAGVVPPSP